jgi:hypothetical protein
MRPNPYPRFDWQRRRGKSMVFAMTYLTVEVEIDHGRIVPSDPSKLPQNGKGLLTVLARGRSHIGQALAAGGT